MRKEKGSVLKIKEKKERDVNDMKEFILERMNASFLC